MGMCADCQWYDGKFNIDRKGRASGHGICRRYPPDSTQAVQAWARKVGLEMQGAGKGRFPDVGWNDWCGEFAPKSEGNSTASGEFAPKTEGNSTVSNDLWTETMEKPKAE
jgi:hypothetical protein